MSSVVVISIDRPAVEKAVLDWVATLRVANPEVGRVIWFGSWVTGLPAPGSDVDLCVVVSKADAPRRERMARYLPVGFPVGVDLCVYTEDELAGLRDSSPQWYRAITLGREM